MENDDPEFEVFLKSFFQPHVPRPLPKMRKPAWGWPVLAAVVMILLACGVWLASIRSTLRKTEGGTNARVDHTKSRMAPSAATLGNLQRLARTDPGRLDAVLNAQASTLLPDVARSNGALHVLAKE